MIDFKTFATWLLLCLLTAGVTVAGVQFLDKSLDLQQMVAKFGK